MSMAIDRRPGYWPEFLIPILNGTTSDDLNTLRQNAEALLKFRKAGNNIPEEFTGDQVPEHLLEDLHKAYCEMTRITDLSERIEKLSKTLFMQLVASSEIKDFDTDEQNYMISCALPGALKASKGGLELLENPHANAWILKFLFAITSHKTIKNNVKAYRGLGQDQMKQLSAKRAAASGWYQGYLNQTVSKGDIELLKKTLALKDHGMSNPPLFVNNMSPYYDLYISLGAEFKKLDDKQLAMDGNTDSYRREEAYWLSVDKNLETFLTNAK